MVLGAAGLVLIVACGALTGGMVYTAGQTTPVVTLAQPVPAGHTLTQQNLATTRVDADGQGLVPASQTESVVGQTTTGNLPAGALLTQGMVTPAPVPPDGSALVGLALEPGQMPARVRAGMTVTVVKVPGDNAANPGAGASSLVDRARVHRVTAGSRARGTQLVSVIVPQQATQPVSAASASGKVAIAAVAPGSANEGSGS